MGGAVTPERLAEIRRRTPVADYPADMLSMTERDRRDLLAEVDHLTAERDEALDDLLYALQVRARALAIAAETIQPGPDGQDCLDRERMITAWVDEAHADLGETPRPLPPVLAEVSAERDLLLVQRDHARAERDALAARAAVADGVEHLARAWTGRCDEVLITAGSGDDPWLVGPASATYGQDIRDGAFLNYEGATLAEAVAAAVAAETKEQDRG